MGINNYRMFEYEHLEAVYTDCLDKYHVLDLHVNTAFSNFNDPMSKTCGIGCLFPQNSERMMGEFHEHLKLNI